MVHNLLQDLSSPREEARLAAVQALAGSSSPEILDALKLALGDESWRVRKAAVQAFRAFAHPELSAKVLVESLSDQENVGRRTAAQEALASMGRQVVPLLCQFIHHPDQDLRKFVVDILGQIGDPDAVEALASLVNDESEVIRLAAVEALGAIGGRKAFDVLLPLLSSPDVSLQFSVLHALGRIGLPLPLAVVKPLLDKKILRRAVYDALGQTQSAEAMEIVVEGLLEPAKSARQAALRAFYKLSENPAVQSYVKKVARQKLAEARLELFEEFLDSDHLPTKRATVALLRTIGTPEAVRILASRLHDDTIQADIEKALAELGPSSIKTMEEVAAKEPDLITPDLIQSVQELETAPPRPMSEQEFETIRDLVAQASGIFFDRELKYLVERRVQRRMEENGARDYSDYLAALKAESREGGEELKKLVNALTTNETYFFREDFQLKAFRDEIIPLILSEKKKRKEKKIKIWSAGCSSGEEPYTIAMLLREMKGLDRFQVEIIGTDINEDMIKKAKEGVYRAASFRTMDPYFLEKYFTAEGNAYRLSEEIKKMVRFECANILELGRPPHLMNLDVLFCRNVIIYFSPEAKRKAVEKFYELLNPGGYLLLGHSESLMTISTKFELVHLKQDLVYRKPAGGVAQ